MQKPLTLNTLFLADGIAALFSTVLALGLKPYFVSLLNVPETIAVILAILGLCFAAYSLSVSRLVQPKVNGQKLLTILITANVLYCVLCLVLLLVFYNTASVWGRGYFIVDAIIVGLIAVFEWQQLRSGLL
jgi:amino acid transporter